MHFYCNLLSSSFFEATDFQELFLGSEPSICLFAPNYLQNFPHLDPVWYWEIVVLETDDGSVLLAIVAQT